VYEAFRELASLWQESDWLTEACSRAHARLAESRHGDLPRWRAAVANLPRVREAAQLDCPAPRLGAPARNPEELRGLLMELHPWRKGPLCLGGMRIDTEWRSDLKWARIASRLDLRGSRVLDVGCGNGYFGLRMLGAGAELVVGIDPSLLFMMQWGACRHFSGRLANYVLPLGVEDLPPGPAGFDCIFSMGVLYHRRNPASHLLRLRSLAGAGATLVLESLVLPAGQECDVLAPEGSYARMRNVWVVPGTERLLSWVREAGFAGAEVVDVSRTSTEEQRPTTWMRFESLEHALDPEDRSRTVEGYPAPERALVIARAGSGSGT